MPSNLNVTLQFPCLNTGAQAKVQYSIWAHSSVLYVFKIFYSFKFLLPSTGIHLNFLLFILSTLDIIPVLLYVQSYVLELCNFFRFNFKQATKPVHDSGREDLWPCKAKIIDMSHNYIIQFVSKIPSKYGLIMFLKLLLRISIIPPWVSGIKILMHQLNYIHIWRASKYILEAHWLL